MALGLEGLCPLIQVFDMSRSLAFYRDVLGFSVIQSAPPGGDCDWCLLSMDGTEVMLNTMYEKDHRPTAPDHARTAVHADTTLFIGCRDLDAAHAHLVNHGIPVHPPVVRDYGMRQLPFADPDGYGICLQWPAGEGSQASP